MTKEICYLSLEKACNIAVDQCLLALGALVPEEDYERAIEVVMNALMRARFAPKKRRAA